MILAIETSSNICSVALSDTAREGADQRIFSRTHPGPNKHSESLAAFTREIFDEAQIQVSDLQGILVSAGPGSFTGLRIGMSFAKGLALPNRTAMAAIPSMEALMWSFLSEKTGDWADMICVFRSHKDQVFSSELSDFPGKGLNLTYGKIEELAENHPAARGFFTNDPELSVPDMSVQRRELSAEMLIRAFDGNSALELTEDHDKIQVLYGLEYKAKKWLK